MFKLINQSKSCTVEARTESAKNMFLNMGYTLVENKPKNNAVKGDDIKEIKPITPKRRKVVSTDAGKTED